MRRNPVGEIKQDGKWFRIWIDGRDTGKYFSTLAAAENRLAQLLGVTPPSSSAAPPPAPTSKPKPSSPWRPSSSSSLSLEEVLRLTREKYRVEFHRDRFRIERGQIVEIPYALGLPPVVDVGLRGTERNALGRRQDRSSYFFLAPTSGTQGVWTCVPKATTLFEGIEFTAIPKANEEEVVDLLIAFYGTDWKEIGAHADVQVRIEEEENERASKQWQERLKAAWTAKIEIADWQPNKTGPPDDTIGWEGFVAVILHNTDGYGEIALTCEAEGWSVGNNESEEEDTVDNETVIEWVKEIIGRNLTESLAWVAKKEASVEWLKIKASDFLRDVVLDQSSFSDEIVITLTNPKTGSSVVLVCRYGDWAWRPTLDAWSGMDPSALKLRGGDKFDWTTLRRALQSLYLTAEWTTLLTWAKNEAFLKGWTLRDRPRQEERRGGYQESGGSRGPRRAYGRPPNPTNIPERKIELYEKFCCMADPKRGASPGEMNIANRKKAELEAEYPGITAFMPAKANPRYRKARKPRKPRR